MNRKGLKIEERPLVSLIPYARNARSHSDAQVMQIAAETVGRSCLGIEIAPEYCDMIIRRWQDFTGEKAKIEPSGDLFPARIGASKSER